MLKAVLFDLDGTLLNRQVSVEQFIVAQYERFIDRLGYIAKFVGDHPEADIWGAKSAKMWTIWKRNSHWLVAKDADAIIDELSEIPLIIEQFKNR